MVFCTMMFHLWLLIFLLLCFSSFAICEFSVWPNTIKVAIVHYRVPDKAINMCLKDVEEKLKLTSSVPQTLNLTTYIGFGCDDISSLSTVANFIENYHPDVFFGPECSTGMPAGGMVTAHYNIPTIGYISIANELSDKSIYSTLARVSFVMGPMGQAVKIILELHNWRRVAIVRSRNVVCTTSLSGIYEVLQQKTFTLQGEFFADSPDEIVAALAFVKNIARIVIVCFEYNPSTALDFLIQAYKSGMVNSEYVYIVPCFSLRKIVSWKPWDNLNPNDTEAINLAKQAFRNVIVVEPTGYEVTSLFNYKNHIEEFSRKRGYNLSLALDDAFIIPRLSDAFYLYGLALNLTIEYGDDYKSGRSMFNRMKGIQFEGVTGKVVMSDQVDRLPNYRVYTWNENNDMSPTYSVFPKIIGTDFIYHFEQLRQPFWNTSDNQAPADMPDCGFTGELCQMLSTSYLAIVIGIFCVLGFTMFSCIIYYRKQKREKDVLKMSWKIDLKDLHFQSEIASKRSVMSLTSLTKSDTEQMSFKSSAANQAIFQGDLVYLKKYKKLTFIKLTKQQLIELKNLRDVHHDNLNRFVGANLDDHETEVIFLWRFCDKGSLMEIVYNDDIQLDMMIKTCLVSDVASGLEYLHKSPIGYHGSLNCSNCVVNSRWTVKLTDFGLNNLLTCLKQKSAVVIDENENYYSKMHFAPELKSDFSYSQLEAAKCADVYSFSIVVYQVLFRSEPVFENEKGLKGDSGGQTASHLVLPQHSDSEDIDERLVSLMQKCWKSQPSERPLMHEVKHLIAELSKKYGKCLMDHVMTILEKYANNLEKLVGERTKQVIEERSRADQLLYQLLPKSVADALKKGESIEAESYDCVTIYFSDIVGFTSICSKSTSFEVISFLNALYSKFDDTMSTYDVYKVETIGDAYLVVSGLPVRNGSRHAVECADMALCVLKLLDDFKIPHFPEVKLQQRIGLHSGPVAAGVVGLKMPRFCLFGDSVNLASKMENTSQPGRIQISDSTYNLLKSTVGKYKFTERGQIETHDYRMRQTFWLEKEII